MEETRTTLKEHKKNLGDDTYADYLDCGGGFMDVYMCQTLNCIS